jgi:drug/metabolite transporter (DMT)-like permease
MSARVWATFVAVSVIWGIPYLFIKVVVDDGIPPGFLAWVRVVLGGAVLVGLAWRSGALAPLWGRLRWLIAFAALEIVVPFPLIAAGEQRVDSSLAAIIIAAAPLFVALLALRFDATEQIGGRRLAGLVIGLVGVVALVGVDIAGRAGELHLVVRRGFDDPVEGGSAAGDLVDDLLGCLGPHERFGVVVPV